MKNRSFVKNNGPFKISEILKRVLPDQITPNNSNDRLISGVSMIESATSKDIPI